MNTSLFCPIRWHMPPARVSNAGFQCMSNMKMWLPPIRFNPPPLPGCRGKSITWTKHIISVFVSCPYNTPNFTRKQKGLRVKTTWHKWMSGEVIWTNNMSVLPPRTINNHFHWADLSLCSIVWYKEQVFFTKVHQSYSVWDNTSSRGGAACVRGNITNLFF